jgi:NAD(P)-dependent dehydrogenase (short-subunit alcohol dehydrogenase family)
MRSDLSRQVAVLTRANCDINLGIAHALTEVGTTVWINYHSHEEAAERTASQIVAAGGNARALAGDVSSGAAVVASAIDFMEDQAIRRGILSLTTPGVSGWQGTRRWILYRALGGCWESPCAANKAPSMPMGVPTAPTALDSLSAYTEPPLTMFPLLVDR